MTEREDQRPPKADGGGVDGQRLMDELHAGSQAAAEHGPDGDTIGSFQDVDRLRAELEMQKVEHAAVHDRYIRLHADFDNFRKRSAKERLELLQFAGENVLKNVLPIVDDMDRAMANNEQTTDIAVVKEGFHLIRQKLIHILGAQGLQPMTDVIGQPFDVDKHEAITRHPAPSKEMKGKVIEVVESGWTLHDKVVRYAKVVVGE